jgi:hypothetical protein
MVIGEPALHFVGWHFENFVRELAELFRECVDGEEIGSCLAVR